MPELNNLIMFTAASALLALAPGPDNIFVLTQSIVYGRAAGLRVTLGLCTGLVVHTSVVTLGVAAVFQTSLVAFNVLKYCGAAYLLYLAWQAFRASSSKVEIGAKKALTPWQLYRRGIIMNATNPKVSLFFIAFLPQFTNPEKGPISLQLILLGVIFAVITIIVFGLISQAAGTIGQWINRSEKGEKILNRIAGLVFASLAIKLILTEKG